ncbi:polysaccharide biosynthesis/export family protein [Fretibacter rubidus]|uniref:polysaccharide biosynthesis/export family protein n=1 Tax=Fretibacter rubidus TaxID=570162 RepID=UPI00352AFB89
MRLRPLAVMASLALGLCAQTALAQVGGDDGWVSLEDIMREEGIIPNSQPQTENADDFSAPTYIPPQRDSLIAGDQFRVTVVGHSQLSKIYTVDDYGEADLDLVGPLIVRGLSLDDLSVNIQRLYNREYLQNAVVKIERYIPPVSIKVKARNTTEKIISAPNQSPLLDVLQDEYEMTSLELSSVIMVRNAAGQLSHVIPANTFIGNSYKGPPLNANDTIFIGEWYSILSENRALKNTPYLNALIKRSIEVYKP